MKPVTIITQARTIQDLQGIWSLQKANLSRNISVEEAHAQGFVTVDHELEMLERMNSPYRHVIAKSSSEEDAEIVVGYCLMMKQTLRLEIPQLRAMFEQMDQIEIAGKPLSSLAYMVMGQVCVAKAFRSQGIFRRMYKKMRSLLMHDFDYIITEIDRRNQRSLLAHQNVGFEVIQEFDEGDVHWLIVGWRLI